MEAKQRQPRRKFLSYATSFIAALLHTGKAGVAQADCNDSVSTMLENFRSKYDLPALACAVILDGKIQEAHAVGYRKYHDQTKVTVNDQFHLGSDTKAMTATLIGLLIEEGKLDWTSKLGDLFPELSSTVNEGFKPVTIEMLLAARAGLPQRCQPSGKSSEDMYHLNGSPKEQRYEFIKLMLAEAPDYTPGSKFVYSNTGFTLLGIIAERIVGTSWEELMQSRLFNPLGMSTAGFGAMGEKGKLDQPLQHLEKGGKPVAVEPGDLYSDNPLCLAPAGLVHCSIGDWAKFINMHLGEVQTAKPLLKESTLKKLHTAPFSGDYFAGWLITERSWSKGIALTHAGCNNMNYAIVWMAPGRKFAVMVCTNFGGKIAAEATDQVCAKIISRYLPA